jgi:type I restriction enzyme S subunit
MSLPRYAEYKESGVPWLGEVPAHWVPLKVKAFTQFCGGGTPSRENLAFWNGDIPWVSPKDMKVERIEGAEERITDEGLSNSSSSLVDSGRLLMVVRSGILKHTIPVAINDVPVALNQDMKALRFKEQSTTSEFFLRWVQGLNNALLLAWAKQGATVESIEHNYLAETLVPLPPLSEQSAIAAFLDRETGKIDALIAEQEKLLTLLAEKRQATISHAVTRGLNPNAPMKDSGVPWLGEAPAHWEVASLRRLVTMNPSKSEVAALNRDIEVSFLPMEAVGEKGQLELDRTRPIREVESGYTYFRDGDVAFAKITPCFENGKGALMRDLVHGIGFGTTELTVVRPHSGALDARFLDWVFRSPIFRLRGEASMYGAGGQKRVPDDFVREFRIAFPKIQEQTAIGDFLDRESCKIDALVGDVERVIGLLKERRSALIAAAVIGKIDVRQAA